MAETQRHAKVYITAVGAVDAVVVDAAAAVVVVVVMVACVAPKAIVADRGGGGCYCCWWYSTIWPVAPWALVWMHSVIAAGETGHALRAADGTLAPSVCGVLLCGSGVVAAVNSEDGGAAVLLLAWSGGGKGDEGLERGMRGAKGAMDA